MLFQEIVVEIVPLVWNSSAVHSILHQAPAHARRHSQQESSVSFQHFCHTIWRCILASMLMRWHFPDTWTPILNSPCRGRLQRTVLALNELNKEFDSTAESFAPANVSSTIPLTVTCLDHEMELDDFPRTLPIWTTQSYPQNLNNYIRQQ